MQQRESHFTYDQLSNDFFGTPGQTDDRVFCSQAQNIVLLGSLFEYDKTLVRDVHENRTATRHGAIEDKNRSELTERKAQQ